MAHIVILPKQGLQMTEGTIMKWLFKEGETVTSGKPLFEMETDKLTITIDATQSGTLLKIIRNEGDVVPITEPIAIVGEAGENIDDLLKEALAGVGGAAAEAPVESAEATTSVTQAASVASVPAGSSTFASPRAKMRAEEKNMDFRDVAGSGPEGLVIERDVLNAPTLSASPLARKIAGQEGVALSGVAGSGVRGKIYKRDVLASQSSASVVPAGVPDIRPMSGMRKVISQRMKQSQNENAQASQRISVRMTEATRCREQLKSLGIKVSFNDIISLSVVRALADKPAINVQLVEQGIWYKDTVNLGIAVALDEGLVVPVVHDAQCFGLQALAESIKEAATGAREGTLSPDKYQGGSFTISNLGMYGLEEFVAIINPPESGILAVGKIEQTPIVVNGNIEIHPMMKLTLSYDHRIIDGAPAAEFLRTIKDYLENPYTLL